MTNPPDGTAARTDLLSRWLDNRHRAEQEPGAGAHRATGSEPQGASAAEADLPALEPEPPSSPAEAPARTALPEPPAPAPTGQHAVAAALFAQLAPEPEPEPAPEPEPEPAPEDPTPTPADGSPLVAAARRVAEQREAEARGIRSHETGTHETGTDETALLGAVGSDAAAPEQQADPAPPAVRRWARRPAPTTATADPAPASPEPVGSRTRAAVAQGVDARPDEAPLRVEFASARTGQVTSSLLIVVGLMVTGTLGWVAWESRDVFDLGLAAVAAVLTLVVWAVRAGAQPSKVVIDRGVLTVSRSTSRSTFDLSNLQLDVEERSRPGARDWAFIIHRRSLGPVQIDRGMVDPTRFMETVRRYRRDV